MKITIEDKTLLENLEKLAQSSDNDPVAVTFELPRMVTLRTSYGELHGTFASLLEIYSGLSDEKVSAKTVGALIKELKDKPVTTFTLGADTVAVSYSLDDMLHSFRKALAEHKNIINLKEKGGLIESLRQKKEVQRCSKINKKYQGAFIHIESYKRPGDSAFFRLDRLNAVKPTGRRNIATLLVVADTFLYPCVYYVDFMNFIKDVYKREEKEKRREYRVYTLNIDNKRPLNGKG